MIIGNTNITAKARNLPLNQLAKGLALTPKEKLALKNEVASLSLIGVIDKEIQSPAHGVETIYLMELEMVDDVVPIVFMEAFDRQTQAHTLFRVPWGSDYIYYMARKTIKDGKVSIGTFYENPDHALILDYMMGENLADTYANLYSFVTGLPKRDGESATDIEARSKRIKELNKQIESLANKRDREPQFNKKATINKELIKLIDEAKSLH